jgi:biopolymer transport protein ExbB/TolQ
MTFSLSLQSVPWASIWWLETSVLVILAIMAFITLMVILEKNVRFRRSKKKSREFAPLASEKLKRFDIEGAIKLSEDFSLESHLARIILHPLKEYVRMKNDIPEKRNLRLVKDIADSETNKLQYEFEAGLSILDSIGRTSSFVGALGGSALTFAIGIAIAIPTIWFVGHFRNRTNQAITECKITALELLIYIEKYEYKNRQNLNT